MRYARYAAAVLFVLLAFGLVALWARSYRACDSLQYVAPGQGGVTIASHQGIQWFMFNRGDRWKDVRGWFFVSMPAESIYIHAPVGRLGFCLRADKVSLPHWFLIVSLLGIAKLLAYKQTWQFSLRTILVATTLFAALLALAVYTA
jgi:hypothetical protein